MYAAVIVSRHPAAVEFIAKRIHPTWHPPIIMEHHVEWRTIGVEGGEELLDSISIISGNATQDNVRDKTVYGNIPLHLAIYAKDVYAVEFYGIPPRGSEYTAYEMELAGAKLTAYRVYPATVGQDMEQTYPYKYR